MMNKQCEELALPVLFPKGRYCYTTERKMKLPPTKYFNVQLLHLNNITIDMDKLDRNHTNLQNTSISQCAVNTTAQSVIQENIIKMKI